MPQGHYTGNRPYNNQTPQQQQQNYNMNRISSPHQGLATSDDLAGHNQGRIKDSQIHDEQHHNGSLEAEIAHFVRI